MDKLEAMRVFVQVAEYQSFVQASQHLGLSAPAVTRHIAQLEQRLGTKLFVRSTRHVRLTDSGQRFLLDAKRILEDINEAEAAVSGSYLDPVGELSVTAPVLFGQKHIVPIVAEYLAQHSAVSIKLLLLDRITHLIEEGIDVAIRIGHLQESSLYARQVGSVHRVICGSPEYFARKGIPQHPNELQHHETILNARVETSSQWTFRGAEKTYAKISPRLHCNHNGGAIEAAVQGQGITRVLSYQVGEELRDGRLQRVLEDYETDILPVNVVHLEGRRANAKVRAFVDLVTQRLRESPFIQSVD